MLFDIKTNEYYKVKRAERAKYAAPSLQRTKISHVPDRVSMSHPSVNFKLNFNEGVTY